MKRITGMLVAAVVIAFVAAGCGGSSSDSSTATPTATSAKTLTAMGNAGQWMSESAAAIPAAIPAAGASIKTTTGSISCVGTFGGFSCVIWDAQGSATSTDHKCDVTGTYDQTLYSFDLEYDCYTFEPGTDVLVDGNWTASITINFNNTAASTAKDAGVAKVESSSTCDVEDISNVCGETYTFDGGSCTSTCDGTASCTAATAFATIDWTVGSRGINMTDECGTYVIAAGTNSLMSFCSPSNTQFTMSSTINGTINGTTIDENIDIDCTLTY